MIDQILNHDSDGASLLNDFELIIIPVMNVDGYIYSHTNDRLWRKNRRPNAGSTCVGTDLNRNYAYQWSRPGASGSPCSETYYGSGPFSEPESDNIRLLIAKYKPTLVSYWDIHAYSALWMSPWGYTCTAVPPDYTTMRNNMQVATAATRAVNGNNYDFGDICRIIYQTSGGSIDYSYAVDDIIHSYSVEAFGTSFTPPTSYIPLVGEEIYAGVKASIKLY